MRRTSDVDVLKAGLYMVRAEASSIRINRASTLQNCIPKEPVKEEPVWTRAELEEDVTLWKSHVLFL